ncbi:MAG: hypothetical protein RLZZ221_1237, partial [Verrucomicrobiota bacterium]
WEEAAASYREAVRLRPDYADAHNDLGAALGRSGRTAESLGHHLRATELKPDDPEVRYNLAVALEASGRPAEAIPHLRAVAAARTGFAPARALLGALLLRSGDCSEPCCCATETPEAQSRNSRPRSPCKPKTRNYV